MTSFPTAADMNRPTPQVGGSVPRGGPQLGVPGPAPIPNDTSRVASYQVPKGADPTDIPAQVMLDQARQTGELGAALDRFGSLADKFAQTLDETSAQDALNQLRLKRQELTYDPQKGFQRFKGGDVTKPGPGGGPLMDELPAQLTTAADDLSGGLSARARRMFSEAATKETLGYRRDLAVHMANESEKYEAAVYKDTQQGALADAVTVSDDPLKLKEVADRAAKAADIRAQQTGTPSQAKAARSNVLRVAIETQQVSNPRQALAMFDALKPDLDGPDAVALATRLKGAATDLEAENTVQSYLGVKPPEAVKQWDPLVQKAAAANNIKPALLQGVIGGESQGVNGLVSPKGAGGLTQLMSGTAKDLGVTKVMDPEQNINGGAKYLRQMLDKYNNNERLALMAYNWGPGNVDKWIKDGSNPDSIPAETRGYVQKVQSYAASYGNKPDIQTIKMDILDRPDLTSAVKASAVTQIEKRSATYEAWKTSTLKGLDDTLEATTQIMIAAPQAYKKGALAQLADGYEAAGDKSKAINTRILAGFEDQLLAFSQSPGAAQNRIIEGLLPGKAKALASGILAGDAKDAAENTKAARDTFAAIKTATDNGVGLINQDAKIKEAFDFAVKGRDRSLVAEMSDWLNGRAAAEAGGQAPSAQLTQLISDLRGKVRAGDQANSSIIQLDQLQKISDQQATAFAKDPMTAGSSTYQNVGPLAPLTDMASRVAQADKIASNRGLRDISPYTEPEIAQLRQQVDGGGPQVQAQAFTQIAATVPARMIPKVAAQIAGKGEGDPLSRSYAAALSFFAEKDPASQQIAGQILQGAKITRDLGEAGKKAPTADQAWQDTLQQRMGNTFRDMGTKVPAVFADAIASVYTYQMHRLGRQGEKIDTDVLDAAAKAVLGDTITRNGQSFLPPAKGVDSYAVDRALRSMTDGDLDGLKTQEGDPITADAIVRRGILTNAGQEGMYYVRVPDPRAGMDPRPIVRPDGREWQLDLRPLLERARMFPPGFDASVGQKPTEMRRRPVAPASPTEGLAP